MWPFTGHKNTRRDNEIRSRFEIYRKDLSNQLQKARENIDDWCRNLTDQIKIHADKQKHLLDEEYDFQRDLLDAIRRDYLDTSSALKQCHQDDRLNELIKECENLKVKVAKIQYSRHILTFIDVTTTEPDEMFASVVYEKNSSIKPIVKISEKTRTASNVNLDRILHLQNVKRRDPNSPDLLMPNYRYSSMHDMIDSKALTSINDGNNSDVCPSTS